jgi:hypothetical protein
VKRQEKAVVVEQLQADLAAMPNIFIAEYRGMTVEQMTSCNNRKTAGGAGGEEPSSAGRLPAGRRSPSGFLQGPTPWSSAAGHRRAQKIVVAADRTCRITLKGGVKGVR